MEVSRAMTTAPELHSRVLKVRRQTGAASHLEWLIVMAGWVCGVLSWQGVPRAVEAQTTAASAPQFDREVLPILADQCFRCHGPDEPAREAGLRLDTEAGLLGSDGHPGPVTAGSSNDSELFRRLVSTDPDLKMPPPGSGRSLTPAQIETIRRWIDSGAKWSRHWAYRPLDVSAATVQPTEPGAEARTPIDHWIESALKQRGLPAGELADKAQWLRRVTFDLTGVPPTIAEWEQYQSDQSPAAEEAVVERLFRSPRYGERMAAEWLDVARFADTHGYQMDRERPMWVYRDWVIRAFQRNLPYDEFIRWQLAGDLLPNPTSEQRLATAFNRLHMQNEEGGIVEEEFRVAYVTDRVNTFGTAFLAQTFECCRCHDHKYDPLTQRDFYSLFAFFQNIDESGQTSYFTAAMPVPTMLLTDAATDERLSRLRQQVEASEAAWTAAVASAQARFEEWYAATATRSADSLPAAQAAYSFESLEQNKTPNSVANGQPGTAVDGPLLAAGRHGQGVVLTGENGFVFPAAGHFQRADEFAISLWVKPAMHASRQVVLHHSKAPIDAGSRGYELLLESGRVAFGLHHMWPGNSLKVVGEPVLPVGEWSHLAITYDGSSRARGVRVYVNGKPAKTDVVRDGLVKDITYGGEPDLAVGHRFRDSGFKGGAVDELAIYAVRLTDLEVAALFEAAPTLPLSTEPLSQLSAEQRASLFEHYLERHDSVAMAAKAELRSARVAENAAVEPIPEAMVMAEMPVPKPAFILQRGQYDSPGVAVQPNTPGVLPAFPTDAPRNRLGLAEWLLHPEHPLTSRVTVNRYWQMLMGRGIVETADNFGSTGTPPSHPELLDWLARDFVSHGWNVQRLLKQIVLSDVYRRSSRVPEAVRLVDPKNEWWSYGTPRRLTAEMIRDQALFVSGLLVEKIGGPSVKPYQPPGLWEEIAMGRPTYQVGRGDDLYRRSLYTYWKRTVPHPAMMVFDASDRNVCTVKRQSTATPLQVLALLNDEQLVEAARMTGQRMLLEGGSADDQRIAWLVRMVLNRAVTPEEQTILQSLWDDQRAWFRTHAEDVQQLLTVGQKLADDQLDRVELAAATVLAQAVMSFEEAVVLR
jgi:hypothetical protein